MLHPTHSLWLLGLIAIAGCGTQAGETKTEAPPSKPVAQAGEKKVELKTLSADETFALVKKKAGKVVIVDCWSTYCAPCMKEFPGLLKLQEKYGDRVACISVSLNYSGVGKVEEDQPAVMAFLEKQKATIDNVFSSTPDEEFLQAIKDTFKLKDRPGAIPLCLLFDKEGKLVKHWVGFTYTKDVEPEVEKLLK